MGQKTPGSRTIILGRREGLARGALREEWNWDKSYFLSKYDFNQTNQTIN